MPQLWSATRRNFFLFSFALMTTLIPLRLAAQGTGTVTGTVNRAEEQTPVPSVEVTVQNTGQSTVTGPDGRYTLRRAPEGAQTIVFRWLGYKPNIVQTNVEADKRGTEDVGLEPLPVPLAELVVSTASGAPEGIVEAPPAMSVVGPEVLRKTSITGEGPLALDTVAGVDVVQTGVNDFNVNARGFNSTLNRRVLVLQD